MNVTLDDLVKPTPKQLAWASKRFAELVPTSVGPTAEEVESELNRLVASGHLHTLIVQDDGIDAYLFWYSLTEDGGFMGEAVVRMTEGVNKPWLYLAAGELVARKLGCRWIRYKSAIPAAIQLAKRHGFETEAVVVFKSLK